MSVNFSCTEDFDRRIHCLDHCISITKLELCKILIIMTRKERQVKFCSREYVYIIIFIYEFFVCFLFVCCFFFFHPFFWGVGWGGRGGGTVNYALTFCILSVTHFSCSAVDLSFL